MTFQNRTKTIMSISRSCSGCRLSLLLLLLFSWSLVHFNILLVQGFVIVVNPNPMVQTQQTSQKQQYHHLQQQSHPSLWNFSPLTARLNDEEEESSLVFDDDINNNNEGSAVVTGSITAETTVRLDFEVTTTSTTGGTSSNSSSSRSASSSSTTTANPIEKQTTYLELSDNNNNDGSLSSSSSSSSSSSHHKFYEVTVDGCNVLVRYGRIGTNGRQSVKTFPDVRSAERDAEKTIQSKRKKGYKDAVMMGVVSRPKKRTATNTNNNANNNNNNSGNSVSSPHRRRAAMMNMETGAEASSLQQSSGEMETSSSSSSSPAPILWKFQSGSSSFGIFVDDDHCWIGNEEGRIFKLDQHTGGTVLQEFKLPKSVKCLVADSQWLYAGCDDGNVYDLTGKIPLVAYEIVQRGDGEGERKSSSSSSSLSSVDIFWLDIFDGILGVSDERGSVYVFNQEGERLWSKNNEISTNGKNIKARGWMVRCDKDGVYHGHSRGIDKYDLETGTPKWHEGTADVLFGWQEPSFVFAGTKWKNVHVISKDTGKEVLACKCDQPVYSCAAVDDGKYIFAGDCHAFVYCFDNKGNRLWKLSTGCGSAFSMQYHKEKLYIVTTGGTMACLDASEQAIENSKSGGTIPIVRNTMAPETTSNAVTTDMEVETTSDVSSGVVVVCVDDGNGKVRVRVEPYSSSSASDDGRHYNVDWNVQFPKNLRKVGERFVVEELVESYRGGFYRALGDIRRLL